MNLTNQIKILSKALKMHYYVSGCNYAIQMLRTSMANNQTEGHRNSSSTSINVATALPHMYAAFFTETHNSVSLWSKRSVSFRCVRPPMRAGRIHSHYKRTAHIAAVPKSRRNGWDTLYSISSLSSLPTTYPLENTHQSLGAKFWSIVRIRACKRQLHSTPTEPDQRIFQTFGVRHRNGRAEWIDRQARKKANTRVHFSGQLRCL